LFADDSLILIRVNREDAAKLQGILDLYEECSEKIINKEKNQPFFSKNTGSEHKAVVMQTMGIS
jgi:hypothetical protein